jgi:hypothetical protein
MNFLSLRGSPKKLGKGTYRGFLKSEIIKLNQRIFGD